MTTFRTRATRGAVLASLTGALITGLMAMPAHAVGDTREKCYQSAGVNRTQYWPTPNVTLRKGSKGICVQELQEDLMAVGLVPSSEADGFADGIFGPKTLKYVLAYQNQYKSMTGGADGIVGPKTWNALISMTTE